VFGHLEQPLRQIEHLTPLHPRRHRQAQAAAAMPAGRSLVRHDPVGLGDLAKRFALVPLLPAAWPPGRFAKAHGLLPQPVARGGLRTRRTVQTQPAPEFRVLSPQRFQLPLKRRNQGRDLRRRNHSPTESYSASPDSPPNPQKPKIQQPVTNQTHPPGQLPISGFFAAVAGVMILSRFGIAQNNAGQGSEIDSIAAVVIGGASLFGGVGSVFGTFVGVCLISSLVTGLILANV
jgi:hypothetical protein